MDSAQVKFLILVGVLVTLLVIVLMRLKRRSRVRAKRAEKTCMTTSSVDPGSTAQGVSPSQPMGWSNYRPRRRANGESIYGDASIEMSTLGVFFNWNGHSWNAHEVLGLQPTSTIEEARAAFELALSRSDSESVPFLTAAFEAIQKAC